MNSSESIQPHSVKSQVAWGAIVAGALLTTGMFLILGSLLAAIDLSSNAEPSGPGNRWIFGLSILPMFLGGWISARLAAGENVVEAIFHGAILWSSTVIVILYLAINNVLMFGMGTVLGKLEDQTLFGPEAASAAWWGFSGIILSLIAAVLGSLLGSPSVKLLHFSRSRRLAQSNVAQAT